MSAFRRPAPPRSCGRRGRNAKSCASRCAIRTFCLCSTTTANLRQLEHIEAETIRFALAYYRGQMSAVARRLGIGRSTLYRKMKEYGFHQADDESLMDKDPDAGDAAA